MSASDSLYFSLSDGLRWCLDYSAWWFLGPVESARSLSRYQKDDESVEEWDAWYLNAILRFS